MVLGFNETCQSHLRALALENANVKSKDNLAF